MSCLLRAQVFDAEYELVPPRFIEVDPSELDLDHPVVGLLCQGEFDVAIARDEVVEHTTVVGR